MTVTEKMSKLVDDHRCSRVTFYAIPRSTMVRSNLSPEDVELIATQRLEQELGHSIVAEADQSREDTEGEIVFKYRFYFFNGSKMLRIENRTMRNKEKES